MRGRKKGVRSVQIVSSLDMNFVWNNEEADKVSSRAAYFQIVPIFNLPTHSTSLSPVGN